MELIIPDSREDLAQIPYSLSRDCRSDALTRMVRFRRAAKSTFVPDSNVPFLWPGKRDCELAGRYYPLDSMGSNIVRPALISTTSTPLNNGASSQKRPQSHLASRAHREFGHQEKEEKKCLCRPTFSSRRSVKSRIE